MNLSRTVSAGPAALTVRPSRLKRWLIRLGVCFGLLLGIWLLRAPILRGIAHAWIISDTLAPADAAVVLGGNLDLRPFAAANLYSNQWVKVVLLANVAIGPAEQMGIVRSHTELNRDILIKQGVPADRIQLVGEGVTSTREEALAVREWTRKTGVHQIIVPTDIFHTRRVHWLFGKVFADTGVRVLVPALEPGRYSAADWWQTEEGLIAFQNEFLKYLLYRWRY